MKYTRAAVLGSILSFGLFLALAAAAIRRPNHVAQPGQCPNICGAGIEISGGPCQTSGDCAAVFM